MNSSSADGFWMLSKLLNCMLNTYLIKQHMPIVIRDYEPEKCWTGILNTKISILNANIWAIHLVL